MSIKQRIALLQAESAYLLDCATASITPHEQWSKAWEMRREIHDLQTLQKLAFKYGYFIHNPDEGGSNDH